MNKKGFISWLVYVIFIFCFVVFVPEGDMKNNLWYLLTATQIAFLIFLISDKVKVKYFKKSKYQPSQTEINTRYNLIEKWNLIKKEDENIDYTFSDKIYQFITKTDINIILKNDISENSNSDLKDAIEEYLYNQDDYEYIRD